MISLVEALGYRCLRDVREPIDSFHVLVGPNASGKSTFLDVTRFLGDLAEDGLEAAVERRTSDPRDLTWARRGSRFELAIEARVPPSMPSPGGPVVRYEVAITTDPELAIEAERVIAYAGASRHLRQLRAFPYEPTPRPTILRPARKRGDHTIVAKTAGGNDCFYPEVGRKWQMAYRLGPRKSALGNLPDDETHFPAAAWLKRTLTRGVQRFELASDRMRQPSPPTRKHGFLPDGSNLPWVIHQLESKANRKRMADWIAHLRTALPDLDRIRTVERPEDRHRYLFVRYTNGIEVPSWLVSDGTLRLLALTLPAYLPSIQGVFLIEEPENGIHPLAIETACQSLMSLYEGQALVASHSPVVLGMMKPDAVLCFAKTESGSTSVARGSEHPSLRAWRRGADLGTLFAAGVLS
jgi:predicted ATPase